MGNIWKALTIIVQTFAYILAIIVAYQIIRILLGGSWSVEDVILTLIVVNISLSFGLMGYLIKLNSIIYGHIQWCQESLKKK